MDGKKTNFVWTKELSVGDEAIDVQHQTLLHNVNKLADAVSNSKGDSILHEIIDFLRDYIDEHFSYEEDYMLAHEYPEYQKHKAIHDSFVDKYREFRTRIKNEDTSLEFVLEVRDFVGNWFLEHISIEDQKYEEYINNKNVKS